MPSSRTAVGSRISRSIATFALILVVLSSQPAAEGRAEAPVAAGPSAAPAPAGMEPRPVGLLPDSDYAIPDGALFVSWSGNDGWEGTEQRPLKTLTAAIDRLEPNGTVVMMNSIDSNASSADGR